MRSRFTESMRKAILEALSEGHSRETAARLAGLDPATLSRWIKRGSEAEQGSLYRQFAEDVGMAEAAARGRALRILNRHMVDQPKWAAWFLERRDPAFEPPMARRERANRQPQVIVLTLNDGTPLGLPNPDVIEGEVIEIEQDEGAGAAADPAS